MALTTAPWNMRTSDEDIDVSSTDDLAIQGSLIKASIFYRYDVQAGFMSDAKLQKDVKFKLVCALADYMLATNLVNTTIEDDPVRNGFIVRARCFVTPNDQVKLLRKFSKKI